MAPRVLFVYTNADKTLTGNPTVRTYVPPSKHLLVCVGDTTSTSFRCVKPMLTELMSTLPGLVPP